MTRYENATFAPDTIHALRDYVMTEWDGDVAGALDYIENTKEIVVSDDADNLAIMLDDLLHHADADGQIPARYVSLFRGDMQGFIACDLAGLLRWSDAVDGGGWHVEAGDHTTIAAAVAAGR